MTVATDNIVHFDGRQFYGAEEIGFTSRGSFIVKAFTTPPPKPQGGYFTALPISPLDHRREHGSRVRVMDEGDSIVVVDDWGKRYRILTVRPVLDSLLREC